MVGISENRILFQSLFDQKLFRNVLKITLATLLANNVKRDHIKQFIGFNVLSKACLEKIDRTLDVDGNKLYS
jgi:hypothetical protein